MRAARRLLVIEDNESIANFICRVAEETGFNARIVSKSSKLMADCESFRPEVVVLDILLDVFTPELDGFAVLNFLHKHNGSARIIILSGQAEYCLMAEQMAAGLKLAVVATLTKPFRIMTLRRILDRVRISLEAPGRSLQMNVV